MPLPKLKRSRELQGQPGLHPIKTDAIARGFELAEVRSFADLGGVWAIDGGYALYARSRPGVVAGTLVDDLIDTLSDAAKRRADEIGLRLVRGNFGRPDVAAEVGEVDAVLLFDVLLHQVEPDWDELLRMYAPHTRAFVIVNPQYRGEETVRLIDLGREEYLRLVPPNEPHERLFDRLDEPHRGRTWRDAHDVWQWGIADEDLVAVADGLGFEVAYQVNEGAWRGNEHFDNAAFVFIRR